MVYTVFCNSSFAHDLIVYRMGTLSPLRNDMAFTHHGNYDLASPARIDETGQSSILLDTIIPLTDTQLGMSYAQIMDNVLSASPGAQPEHSTEELVPPEVQPAGNPALDPDMFDFERYLFVPYLVMC